MYPDHTASEVAKAIGCDTRSVMQKAAKMGIKKSDAFLDRHPKLKRFIRTAEEKDQDRIISQGRHTSCPVYSTAHLLMLPCRGLGIVGNQRNIESSANSLRKFKENETAIRADLLKKISSTKTAKKYGMCYRSLKKFLQEGV